jgi:ribosomal protein S18 acetylase RimI-like enzyme
MNSMTQQNLPSEDIIVREAQPSDAVQMIAFVQRLAEEPGIQIAILPGEFKLTVAEERQILADYASADNAIYLVAEAGGRIIGLLNCKGGHRQATRHSVVLGMSVDKEWRNRGVGSMLMRRAVEWAKNSGVVTRIELNVFVQNEMAIHLYQKFGFEIEGRRRNALLRYGKYNDDYLMAVLL